ncbi:MAG: hypothetical protein JST65_07700 [Acidobacteria bacterium]|nr:hypothetical protein [Acidobacteriota bacterium]
MSTEIDPRITPALHPLNVREVEGYDDETAPVLAPTETAFDAAYRSIGEVYAAKDKVERNLAWTPEARLIQLDDFARKHLDRVTRTFDTTRANLEKGIAALEADLTQPVVARAAASISAEVRAHVKALPTGKRMETIRKAIEDGDTDVATAVLGAPAMLSGLDANMQKILLRLYHERTNPSTAKRLKVMQGAKDLIERNAPLIFGQFEKAVGAPGHKVKKLREAKSEAEAALILRDLI